MRGRSFKQKKRQRHQRKPFKTQKKRVLQGRVQKNPRGFAFILPQDRAVPDAYVSKEQARALLNDDVVEFIVHRQGPRRSAEVIRIVKRGQTKLVGRVEPVGPEMALVTSEGEAYPLRRPKGVAKGDWAIARFEEYPSEDSDGSVAVEEVLGRELKPEHDNLITIARYSLDAQFNMEVSVAARKVAQEVQEREKRNPNRVDLRDLPFVTIDGEDAKDFDDAVYVRNETGSKAFTLFVAIADVSAFVIPKSIIDQAARRRSTSVYFPGFCLPMLPEVLSNDVCSLRPREDRLALTAEIHFDRHGEVEKSRFYECWIRTAARLTYNQLHAYYENEKKVRDELGFLSGPLEDLRDLYEKLFKQRKLRGVLDFDLPECKIQLDGRGRPVGIEKAVRYESHRLIEEFMIAANRAVAFSLNESKTPALYRVHESPEPESLDEVNRLLKNLGVALRIKDLTPLSFSKVLSETEHLKGAHTLHQTILRLQKQAKYGPDPLGHFGLALQDYTHFTSPIRRYPDLVVHRALKRFIYKVRNSDKHAEADGELEALGIETSEKERRAMEAERFITRRKQCWYMAERLGTTYPGRVAGLIARGLFVEISELALDGFVPIESLKGHYEFDENRNCFRKRPGHTTINLGDPFPIQVVAVDVSANEITFAPMES